MQIFDNFNYSATGFAAGIPISILLRAEVGVSGTAPYGDDPEDKIWILRGIDYAKSQSF